MNYRLAFDAVQSGSRNWSITVFGLLFVFIGVLFVKYRRHVPVRFPGGGGPRAVSAFAYSFLIFSVLWTTITFVATLRDYLAVKNALQGGTARIVEGRVEEFVPMPFQGHASEHFSVCGVRFSYSDYSVTPGFNRTSSHGGPIRPGLWVRISYVDNTIARLEIATGDPGPQAKCRRSR